MAKAAVVVFDKTGTLTKGAFAVTALIPASALAGACLLLSDTLARTAISPVVLPVGAITSFFGAPLFLFLLARGHRRR